ncbi:two-component sensor histidine kinase [Paractinoplanes abujensis]|uniref:histidine kinase n=1 Tax=Paractinoplanes abujensis TaxID=882441 RepID=A0A7W7G7Z0_9ACTN|nr:histidine kinase [Actinoplanes abujensis]MBB4697451.1 signal transduction histidine kinase [Actinoplanes abujensis]GID18074.1 two-component sensor histidine kinase [Actinoplanes abujensis]
MTAASPSFLIRRLNRGQLLGIDALLAVLAAAFGWFAATEPPASAQPAWFEPAWLSAMIGLALGAPVAVRRLWPIAATAVVLVVAVFAVVSGAIPSYAGAAPIVALGLVLYTVGVELPRRRSVPVVLVSVVALVASFAVAEGDSFELLVVTWMIAAFWAVGRTVRERRAHAASRAEQATALAVEQERLRLARELHDIVAHSMSMIAIKAAVADHVGDDRPEEMRAALRVIGTTSRQSLAEIRRALALVRTEAALRPAPTLADLPELVRNARSTGLRVDLEVRMEEELPSDVALSAYRMVQEGMTNVVKHSGAAACRVEVVGRSGEVSIRITDDGAGATLTGPAAPSGSAVSETRPAALAGGGGPVGQGLIGMRERAAQFGGEFRAGPQPDRGWEVAATLRFAP